MNIYIDTSGFLAILDADDDNHLKAKETWVKLISSGDNLICNNYVLVETFALVLHRLGFEAVRVLQEDMLPVVRIEWVDEFTHNMGISAMLTASRRKLSLVDCVSFEMMRRLGLKKVFAIDKHFSEQGFKCIP